MEQMPDIEGSYKGKKRNNKKKGTRNKGEVLEFDDVCSLSGMCELSSDMMVSSRARNLLLQTQDSRWHLETPELKERISHKNEQLNHDNSRYVDKFVRNKSSTDDLQPNFSNDFMFPPLNSQIERFKLRTNCVQANQHVTQPKLKKTSWKEEDKDNAERSTLKVQIQKSVQISTQEHKSELEPPNFLRVRREKAFPAQANERKEMIVSHCENSETKIQLESNAQSKGVMEYVEVSNISVSMRELSLNSRHKISEQAIGRASVLMDEQGILKPSSDKPSPGHFYCPEKLHAKVEASQGTCKSSENNVDLQQVGKDTDNSDHKVDSLQQPSALLNFNLNKNSDASHGSYTQPFDDSTAEASKNQIIFYLRMVLKKQEHQAVSDDATDTKSLPGPECSATDEPQVKVGTGETDSTLKTEEKMSPEDYSVCEEMLNSYIVISNLPFGASKEEILYHMGKIGPISYLIMEKYRAHIIFFKAEDAEIAFGLRHVLFGRDLVVCRPKRPSCTLHLSGLTSNTPDEDVIKMVSEYGVIVGFYHPTRKLLGVPMGYCFIKVDKQAAQNILKQSSLVVNNVRIFVEVSSQSEVKFSPHTSTTQPPPCLASHFGVQGGSTEYKMLLRNVPQEASYDLIKEHFQEYGKLRKVYVKNGQGFVIFASRDSLEQALSSRHIILGTEVKPSQC